METARKPLSFLDLRDRYDRFSDTFGRCLRFAVTAPLFLMMGTLGPVSGVATPPAEGKDASIDRDLETLAALRLPATPAWTRAAGNLARRKVARAVPVLEQLLGYVNDKLSSDATSATRAILSVLGNIGTPEALRTIQDYLVSQHSAEGGAGRMALGILARHETPEVIALLRDAVIRYGLEENRTLATRAVTILGGFQLPQARAALEEIARDLHIDPFVSGTAMEALGDAPVSVLTRISRRLDISEEMREIAFGRLEALSPGLAVDAGNPASASGRTRRQVAILDAPFDHLHYGERTQAAKALGNARAESAISALARWAGHTDPLREKKAMELAVAATKTLGTIGTPAALLALARLVEEGTGHTRAIGTAIHILAEKEFEPAVPHLLKWVHLAGQKVGRPAESIHSAVRALGRIGTPAAMTALREIVRTRHDYVRETGGFGPVVALAVQLLENSREKDVVEDLVACLRLYPAHLRKGMIDGLAKSVIRALDRIGTPAALAYLAQMEKGTFMGEAFPVLQTEAWHVLQFHKESQPVLPAPAEDASAVPVLPRRRARIRLGALRTRGPSLPSTPPATKEPHLSELHRLLGVDSDEELRAGLQSMFLPQSPEHPILAKTRRDLSFRKALLAALRAHGSMDRLVSEAIIKIGGMAVDGPGLEVD